MKEVDEWKTAFRPSTGHYQYKVMPYGLSGSPSVFQCFINHVLRECLRHYVIAYIDDILIYSPNVHVSQVSRLLELLIEIWLNVKGEIFEFYVSTVSFLGYIMNQESVSMDTKKVSAVTDLPQPFYHTFIKIYSVIAAPLTLSGLRRLSLTLKRHSLILLHPDPEKPFTVEVL